MARVGALPARRGVRVALAAGGCSFSYQLDNALAKKDDAEQVGSLRPALAKAAAEPPAEADLAIARAALSEVLAKGRQARQHALGKSEDRSARHRHAGLAPGPGWGLPRLSRKLRKGRQQIVAAGEACRRARQMGSPQFAAPGI